MQIHVESISVSNITDCTRAGIRYHSNYKISLGTDLNYSRISMIGNDMRKIYMFLKRIVTLSESLTYLSH